MEQLYVGIDVSSSKHAAYLMKSDGNKFSSFPMQNDLSGAKMISEKIVSALTKLGLHDVVIGIGATSVYRENLVYALREDGNLGRFHRKIHVLNPRQVKNLKKSYPELPKNDPVDSFVIADRLRFGRIGKVYSAGIIAEIGDSRRFAGQASVTKYAGLVWMQHKSNEFQAEDTRLIKSGNCYLRYYLLEAANSVRRCDSEFRRYYDLKFKEVNKYQHKCALALTARKLVRLVFRLLKDSRLYKLPEG